MFDQTKLLRPDLLFFENTIHIIRFDNVINAISYCIKDIFLEYFRCNYETPYKQLIENINSSEQLNVEINNENYDAVLKSNEV